jgi:hypothetical protein
VTAPSLDDGFAPIAKSLAEAMVVYQLPSVAAYRIVWHVIRYTYGEIDPARAGKKWRNRTRCAVPSASWLAKKLRQPRKTVAEALRWLASARVLVIEAGDQHSAEVGINPEFEQWEGWPDSPPDWRPGAIPKLATRRHPVGGDQAPVGGDQAPVGGDQAPVGGDQAPVGGDQAPVKPGRNGHGRGVAESSYVSEDSDSSDKNTLSSDKSDVRALVEPNNGVVRRIFEHWRLKMGKSERTSLDSRREKIQARLKDSTPDEIIKAIDACAESEWHMGKNPNRKLYNELVENIIPNRRKVESWGEEYDRRHSRGRNGTGDLRDDREADKWAAVEAAEKRKPGSSYRLARR